MRRQAVHDRSPPIFLYDAAASSWLFGDKPERVIHKQEIDMTTTTENQQTKKAPPSDVIFPVGADGKPDYKARTAAWSHSKGGGKNFTIGGKRYVMFPNKPKPATEGKGA